MNKKVSVLQAVNFFVSWLNALISAFSASSQPKNGETSLTANHPNNEAFFLYPGKTVQETHPSKPVISRFLSRGKGYVSFDSESHNKFMISFIIVSF